MKRQKDAFHEEVEDLSKKVVVEEAVDAVWKKLERALETLDEQSLTILGDYFNGLTIEELSKKHSLKRSEVELWVGQIKRELTTNLKGSMRVKQ